MTDLVKSEEDYTAGWSSLSATRRSAIGIFYARRSTSFSYNTGERNLDISHTVFYTGQFN